MVSHLTIGRYYRRDHTSVLHGCSKIELARRTDPDVDVMLRELECQVEEAIRRPDVTPLLERVDRVDRLEREMAALRAEVSHLTTGLLQRARRAS